MSQMNEANTALPRALEARRPYATGLGRVVNSPLYRATVGALVETRRRRMVMLTVIPVLWIAVFHIGPLVQMLRISLYESYPIFEDRPVWTLQNYALFFQEPIYRTPFIRSLIFASLVTTTALVIVYPVAYFLAKIVRPERRVLALLLLLVPFWAGEVIRTFSVIMLLANRGAVNMVLMQLGIVERPIPMLYTYFSIGFGVIYLVALYMLLPLYAAIEKIPKHLIDAAADLGAGPFTRFRRVVLPLSRDGIVAGCSLVFLTCIGVFSAPILLGGPGTVMFAQTISGFFHGASDKWPIGAAFAMIMFVASLTTVGIFMKTVGGSGTRLLS
jgi:spermidine/putrescine transport system permease protein